MALLGPPNHPMEGGRRAGAEDSVEVLQTPSPCRQLLWSLLPP